MTNKIRKPTGPGTTAGAVVFGLFGIAALWLADWRLVATGAVVFLLGAFVDGART